MTEPATEPKQLSNEEIGGAVRRIVAEALGRSEDEVKLTSILMDELGAESLDFLDIVFRLEREFGIQITRGEMERAARGDLAGMKLAVAPWPVRAAEPRIGQAYPGADDDDDRAEHGGRCRDAAKPHQSPVTGHPRAPSRWSTGAAAAPDP
jgi:acyl carrier protein